MTMPKAYDAQYDQKYQILCRNKTYSNSYEHCDYAKDKQELKYLLENYKLAYGIGWQFKVILLPKKYWKNKSMNKIKV